MLFGDINLDDLGIVDGNNWVAVGTAVTNSFRGTFDGNGYTISNLKINKPKANQQGFFGYTEGAKIKNTALENVNVKGGGIVGAFAATINGRSTIQNSYSTGNITGSSKTGGLVGVLYNSSSIQNSYSTGNVTGDYSAGGLVGELVSSSYIQNSYSTGNVIGANRVGGLVGATDYLDTSIKNSYSTGDTFSASGAISTSSFGGLVGWVNNHTSITNSYSTGQNKATVGYRGGFIGGINSGITLALNNYAYATQSISGIANGNGIALNQGTISGTEQTSGQNAAFFNNKQNIKNLLNTDIGANQWNFTTLPPKLKWQKLPKDGSTTFQIGTDGTNLSAISMDLSFTLGNFNPNFTSAESSRTTMTACDTLLKQINTKRGEIGANTNIISSIVDGNTITNENLTSSKSRIQDADIAKESATMVKNQILEQATSSLLSQSSNMNGQLALQLLSGLGGRR